MKSAKKIETPEVIQPVTKSPAALPQKETVSNDLTREEKDFLLSCMNNLKLSPAAPDALAVCNTIQSIVKKLNTK